MGLIRWGSLALALTAIACPLAGQAKNAPDVPGSASDGGTVTRHGLWGGVGLGYGSHGCDGCTSISGFSGNLRIGGTVNQNLSLGFGTFGFYHSESSYSLTQGAYVALVDVYPSAAGGFFLQGGIGYGAESVDIPGYGTASVTGFADLLGVGVDLRSGRNFYFTPFLNYFQARANGGSDNVLQLGLAATWH